MDEGKIEVLTELAFLMNTARMTKHMGNDMVSWDSKLIIDRLGLKIEKI